MAYSTFGAVRSFRLELPWFGAAAGFPSMGSLSYLFHSGLILRSLSTIFGSTSRT